MKKRIIIVILLLMSFTFLFLFFKNVRKEKLETNIPLDSKVVKELDAIVHPSEDATLLKELYQKNRITNLYQIATGINAYIKKQNDIPELITKDEALASVQTIFGANTFVEHQSVYLLNAYGCGYKFQNNTYEHILGCDGDQFSSFKRKIVAATKNENTITITEKVIYIYNDWDDAKNKVSIYNNAQKEKLLDYFETPSIEELQVNIEAYLDQASTYIYTFQKQNDAYIWIGFSPIDE